MKKEQSKGVNNGVKYGPRISKAQRAAQERKAKRRIYFAARDRALDKIKCV